MDNAGGGGGGHDEGNDTEKKCAAHGGAIREPILNTYIATVLSSMIQTIIR